MNDNLSPGNGVGQTGYYEVSVGIAENECLWHVDQCDHDKVISINSAIGIDGESVLIWARHRESERVMLESGVTEVVSSFDYLRGMSSQISKSGGFLLAGPLLLDSGNYDLIKNFEETLVPGSSSFHELVNAPVLSGFLYLTGNSFKPPRELYYINAGEGVVESIGGGYSTIVTMPGADFYYAIRERQLMCGYASTGEVIWQRSVPLQWSEHISLKKRSESKLDSAAISCNEMEVMLFVHGAGFYRFEAKSGELLHRTDTVHECSGLDASYFRESDLILSSPDMYYVFHCHKNRTNAVRGYAFEGNRLVFEKTSEGGYEAPQFIAGDLIYYVDSVLGAYLARDRYNGELVWQSKDYMPRIHFGLPVGNKIFLYGGAGHMICYEWNEPYESQHRLTA